MTHEEILSTLCHYVDYLIAGSTAEAPLWNIEKVRSGKAGFTSCMTGSYDYYIVVTH